MIDKNNQKSTSKTPARPTWPFGSISIKNFRSYKDVRVEFHPGLNVVIGDNDVGKSNLRRAMEWVINNRPTGDGNLPLYWDGDPSVLLNIGNKIVGRHKSKSENLYTLTHDDGTEDEFRAFGQNVPETIKEHLNMSPLNIDSQWDTFFLLDKSPGDVARHYNELVNLEIIDRAIKNIASTLKAERAALKIQQELEIRKIEELKGFDWLPDAEKGLIELERLDNYLRKLNSDWSNLSESIEKLERLERTGRNLSEVVGHDGSLRFLLNEREEIETLENKHENLTMTIQNLESLAVRHEKLKEIIQYRNETDSLIRQSDRIAEISENENELMACIERLECYRESEKRPEDIIGHADKADRLLILNGEIEDGITEYNFLQDSIERWGGLIRKHEVSKKKLKELEREFVESMPDQCPLCGRDCDCGQ